jgi:IS605 OrfB family transposase
MMLLTIKAKLNPTDEQRQALSATMERFNEACNYVSSLSFQEQTFGKRTLQKQHYRYIRDNYGLSAQLAVRAIAKVSESYRGKGHRQEPHTFKPHSAVVYDQRILSFKALDLVSILTLEGRKLIPLSIGAYAQLEQRRVRGQADLVLQKGVFYLCVVVEVEEDTLYNAEGCLGVDLGLVNIATTSDGQHFSGDNADSVRTRYTKLEAALQSKGTKSAKRHLKRTSGKERKFKTNLNHCISKLIVGMAKDTKRAIALEDLTHIRSQVTVRNSGKAQRGRLGKWAFGQLRQFIDYKAQLNGISTFVVDPRNTSKQCSECGHIDKANRKTQSEFVCVACGRAENADINAAKNIASRAVVNQPIVSLKQKEIQAHNFSVGN